MTMTVEQIRAQLSVRIAWEEKIQGGVSKVMQQVNNAFSQRIKVESDLTYRYKALGEVVKRMNLNNIPKDAKWALFALEICDKQPREIIGNALDHLTEDEKAVVLADLAWKGGEIQGLEIMTY